MKAAVCGQCAPCLDNCCCVPMKPWPAPSRAVPPRPGQSAGVFKNSTGEGCCGPVLITHQVVAWNWGGDPFSVYNPNPPPCGTPEKYDFPAGTAPECLSSWLSDHGGLLEVQVSVNGCDYPTYFGLGLTGAHILIPRGSLDMVPKDTPEYCDGVELMRIGEGQYACVIIVANDLSEIRCSTECFSGEDGCNPCSSSSSSSNGSSGSGSSGSDSSGSSSGSGSSYGSSSGSSSGDSSSGSSSGSSSSSSGGGDGGGGGGSSSSSSV